MEQGYQNSLIRKQIFLPRGQKYKHAVAVYGFYDSVKICQQALTVFRYNNPSVHYVETKTMFITTPYLMRFTIYKHRRIVCQFFSVITNRIIHCFHSPLFRYEKVMLHGRPDGREEMLHTAIKVHSPAPCTDREVGIKVTPLQKFIDLEWRNNIILL